MKVLLVGASGIIGSAVKKALGITHEIISATYSNGDLKVDLGSPSSIKAMFEAVGRVDAIISTAGKGSLAPLNQLTDADYDLATDNKLMGQINLVRFGQKYLSEGGSITLSSGMAGRKPMPNAATISMVCGGLESFVKSAALELHSLRLNIVAPMFVKETMAMMGLDTEAGLSAADTAKAYVAAVQGSMNGEILDTPDYA